MIVEERVRAARNYLAQFYGTLAQSPYFSNDSLIDFIMEYRHYNESAYSYEMETFLSVYRPIFINSLSDVFTMFPTLAVSDDLLVDAGLLTVVQKEDENGNKFINKYYALEGGYVFPMFNFGSTEIIGLVAWCPINSKQKYKYSSTIGFTPKVYYFNTGQVFQKSYSMIDDGLIGTLFVCEGIFDSISLCSIGLPTFGMLGLQQSNLKAEILRRFRKICFIPDNDKAGSTVNPMKANKGVWKAPVPTTTILLPKGIKDADDFIKYRGDALDLLVKGAYSDYCFRI